MFVARPLPVPIADTKTSQKEARTHIKHSSYTAFKKIRATQISLFSDHKPQK